MSVGGNGAYPQIDVAARAWPFAPSRRPVSDRNGITDGAERIPAHY